MKFESKMDMLKNINIRLVFTLHAGFIYHLTELNKTIKNTT